MFETLDTIDWERVGDHISGQNWRIPSAIRALVSSEKEKRLQALEFLFGSFYQLEFESHIFETTAKIIPFTLEVLANKPRPTARLLVRYFAWFLYRRVHVSDVYFDVQQLRNYIAVYDAIEQGLPIYLQMLSSRDMSLRRRAIILLGCLGTNAESILPALLETYALEKEWRVKREIVKSVEQLLWDRSKFWNNYAPFLNGILEDNVPTKLKYTAAIAVIKTSRGYPVYTQQISPLAISTLVECFKRERKTPFRTDWMRYEIAETLAWLADQTPLVRLLHHPQLTERDAQFLALALVTQINSDHLPLSKNYWFTVLGQDNPNRIIYTALNSRHIVEQLSNYATRPVRELLDNEAFWSTPTNFFSHFFGLPDDREALRALIDQKSEQS